MRSWSISVGRLFGVDVRLHLTFLILPLFIYWTDYAARQQNANGAKDLALVGIILGSVGAHELGHMAVCAAGNRGVGPGVKRRFLCNIYGVLMCRNNLLVYRKFRVRSALQQYCRSAKSNDVTENLKGESEQSGEFCVGRPGPSHKNAHGHRLAQLVNVQPAGWDGKLIRRTEVDRSIHHGR